MTSEAKSEDATQSARCVTEATRQLTALEGAVQAIVSELRVGQLDRTTASIKREMLESLWRDGNATLLRIEAQTGPHPRRATFSEAYLAARRSLERIREAEGAAPPPMLDTTTLAASSRPDHLPRIELPRFSGAPSEWPSFAARFEKRVVGLTEDADRYAFLAKCFEQCDIARHSCEAFENAGMPFGDAWAKLEERFYKKRVAFLGQLQTIFELPKMAAASSNALMRVIDVVETAVSTARQIAGARNQPPSAIEDGLLVCAVMSRLDEETVARITRKQSQHTIPSWAELRDELDKMASQLYYDPRRKQHPGIARNLQPRPARAALACNITAKMAPTRTAPARTALPGPATARTALPGPAAARTARSDATPASASGTNTARPSIKRCYACDKAGHVGTLCPELRARSVMEAINFIMAKGKCVNCFSGHHVVSECPSDKRCQVCGKKHHTMLHVEAAPSGK